MHLVTTNHHTDAEPVGYLASQGHGTSLATHAACSCGWAGPAHPWGPDSAAATRTDLAAHLEGTGHATDAVDDHDAAAGEGGVHRRCGHLHHLNDDCPVAYDSPAGQLLRVTRSGLADPEAATDRLAAAVALGRWVDDQARQAVISARLAGMSWDHIAGAAHLTVTQARDRWGQLIDRLEAADVLHPATTLHNGRQARRSR